MSKITEKVFGSLFNDSEKQEALFACVAYENNDMQVSLNNDLIAGCDKILSSDNSTDDEKIAATAKKQRLQAENDRLLKESAELYLLYSQVLQEVSRADNGYTSNNIDAFRNILRLSACVDNRRLLKKAIIFNGTFEQFYNLFERCHSVDGCAVDFMSKNTAAQWVLNKDIKKELEKALKALFFLPVESRYNNKVSVKFNSTDIGMLHEAYVTGLKVLTSKNNKTGEISLDGIGFKTAITKKTNKDGTVIYSGVRFLENMANIAMVKLFG